MSDTLNSVPPEVLESLKTERGQTEKQTEQGQPGAPQELLVGKFKSADDLVKGYKELETKIGELGVKAKDAEKAKVFELELNQIKAQIAKQGIELEIEKPKENDEIKELSKKFERSEFLRKNESAESFLDLIEPLAATKYGGNLAEAFNDPSIQKVIELDKKAKAKKEGTSVIETNKKIIPDGNTYAETFKKAIKGQTNEGWVEVLKQKGVL